jgi:hypothetical protein
MGDGGKMDLMKGIHWQEINQISPPGKLKEHIVYESFKQICMIMNGGI